VVQASNPTPYNTIGTGHAPAAVGAGNALPWLKNTAGTTWTGVFANHDSDWSTPNDVYWNWVIYCLQRCQAYGFAVVLDWIYWGFNQGAADGWITTIANSANTTSVMQAFGTYLALKCQMAGLKNIIFSFGTDTFPSDSGVVARIIAFHDGWLAGGGSSNALGHNQRSSDSQDNTNFAARCNINGVYPGTGASNGHAGTYGRVLTAFGKNAGPAFCLEAVYEGEGGRTREQVRSYGWWSLISGIAGYVYGNNPVWDFDTGWQTALTSNGAADAALMFSFFESLSKWWTLVPDGQGLGTLVTAGGGGTQTLGSVGTGDGTGGLDHVSAAVSPDGATLIAYVPHAHSGSVTIDMTKMRGTTTARWFDPTSGSYTAIGSFANTGTQAFTPPGANSSGSNDWILRLDA
jgi:hypothetical protein